MSKDGHRSIGERMSRAKSADARLATAKEWSGQWCNEQTCLLRKLKAAIAENDREEQIFIIKQLEAVNEKRHAALPRVFERLAGGDSNERNI